MITHKLKINDSKTEFIVFRSPQMKCDLRVIFEKISTLMIILLL